MARSDLRRITFSDLYETWYIGVDAVFEST